MANKVLDEKGFVNPNQFLVVFFPMWQGILAWRVLGRVNMGFEKINYGVLPLDGDGDGVIDGIVPANSSSGRFAFPWAVLPTERATDMFWFDNRDKLKHVKIKISPYLLRNFFFLAVGVQEANYQGMAVADDTVPSDFGYWRGTFEIPVLPYMHFQMSCYNHTNMDLIGDVEFEYGEYMVELVDDPLLLFNLMNRKEWAHWMNWPGETKIPTDPFVRSYNIEQPIPLSKRLEDVRRSVAEFMSGGSRR